MTEIVDDEMDRGAMAGGMEPVDLGPLPPRIRGLAGFWGGAASGARVLYELAQRDGLVRSIAELRSDIAKIHDLKARAELFSWLESRAH